MGNRIKLPKIDFAKVGDDLGKTTEGVVKSIRCHKDKLLGAGFILVVTDNIRMRIGWKKDQKAYEESSVKQQKIVRKHEAEINILREEAEQAQKINRRLEQIERAVKNITEGSDSDEQV